MNGWRSPQIGTSGRKSAHWQYVEAVACRKKEPAIGPKLREDSDLKLIRECAVCCKSHTQRNSASRSSYPGTHRTQFHFATLNDRANQSAVRPRRPRLTRSLQRRPSWRGDGC
jgi:hypothetical protein